MEFDTPSPQKKSGHDYSTNPLKGAPQFEYKTGKLEAVASKMFFDGRLLPEDQVQRFSFYDSEEKMRRSIDKFTAYVLGVYSGCFSHGAERGDVRYFSNLVPNSKTDIIQVSYWAQDRSNTLAIGNYQRDIAPVFRDMGRKSAFTKVMVAYIAEMEQVVEIHMNATLEAGFLKAIAAAHGIPEHKASLFGLADLTTEVWVFQFDSTFEPVVFTPKDARNMPPTVRATKDDKVIYFQPIFKAGVLRSENPKYAESVKSVVAMSQELSDYIASEQANLKGVLSGGMTQPTKADDFDDQAARVEAMSTPTTPRQNNGFPDAIKVDFPADAPPVDHAVGAMAGDEDSLPF